MKDPLKAHLALFAVALLYGANYVIAKSVMPEPIPAFGFIFMRVLGAGILFWIIRMFIPERVDRSDMGRLFLCGMTGVAINQLLFFKGLSITSPMDAAIIMTSNPILVMLIAAWLLSNRITRTKLLGIILGTTGALILILSADQGSRDSSVLGNLLVFINAASYAFYLVLVKPLMYKYKPITVISWVFLFGFIPVIFVGATPFSQVAFTTLSSWQIFSIIYVVLGVTFLTFLFNIYALKNVQPTVASSYIYLQPLMAAIFTWLFSLVGIEEFGGFSLLQGVCTLLIFSGLYLISANQLALFKGR